MKDTIKDYASAKNELKERIIVVAMDAFTKNGVKGITMDDIASSLSISKRTLYETFEDKEELLAECVRYRQREMQKYGEELLETADNVLEVILKFYQLSIEHYHKTNKRFFDEMNKYPRVCALMRESRDENSEHTIEFFKKGVDQGIFRKDVNFEIIYMLVREQVDLLLQTNLCNKYSFVEVYESIMFTFMRGISTLKGQQILEDFIQEYRQQK